MGIQFEYRSLEGLGPSARALLILPQGELRVGRERLKASTAPGPSGIDDSIVRAATSGDDPVRVTVFCGRARGGAGSWGFADDLDESEVQALATNLVRSQLATYRRLFAAGVAMHVRIDFGGREQEAFRRAHEEVRREICESSKELVGPARELADLDVWLLEDFVFFFAVPVDRLLQRTFGDHAHAMAQRKKHADRKRSSLSAAALGALR